MHGLVSTLNNLWGSRERGVWISCEVQEIAWGVNKLWGSRDSMGVNELWGMNCEVQEIALGANEFRG